ncbi:putative Kinase [Melia azedarach]|uniref:Kinase n=1 Tax=Melia azedarach TaxID=155640 RepID=A0ACC1WW56_MELAZ|nr:putative Kinase [Melia azedarach]
MRVMHKQQSRQRISQNFLCFVFLLVNIFVTKGQQCYSTGNFTNSSSYGSHRNFILSSLVSNASENGGFTTATFGQDPDTVYALALCRGDTSSKSCADCVNATAQHIMNNCPNQKEAYSWEGGGRDPFCFFDNIWESLMERMVKKVSTGTCMPKFATDEANFTNFQKIYTVMQCTPDISQSDCESCLQRSVADYQNCCHGKQGGVVMRPNCFFRWDLYPFYNETFCPSLLPSPGPTDSKDSRGIASVAIAITVVATVIFAAIVAFTCVFLRKRIKIKQNRRKQERNVDAIDAVESLQLDFGTIRVATNNFAIENKLGRGGFGEVYKGRLPSGQDIAVKRLSKNSGQGEQEFKNEVVLVAKLQHRNLVRILGFCFEGNERLLIYEFVSNSSLDNYIFDPLKRSLLNWETRYKIIGGIARGILYLHEDSRLRIIHRDLKASNILLDGDMNPKVSDFGMARLFDIDQTQGDTSRIVGTFGYMAPEYVTRGNFSVKSDVFSFGVIILEIISGQKNTFFCHEDEPEDLLTYAWKNWMEGTALNLIDPVLKVGSSREILRCIHIGLLCVQENVANRPTMATVCLLLSSSSLSLPIPSKPPFFMQNTMEMQSNSEFNIFDPSKSSSVQFTVNEASTSELDPR